MLALLKGLAVKISELYDKLFRTWTRMIIFFVAYFIMLELLPGNLVPVISLSFVLFILISIIARMWRKKGGKG